MTANRTEVVSIPVGKRTIIDIAAQFQSRGRSFIFVRLGIDRLHEELRFLSSHLRGTTLAILSDRPDIRICQPTIFE